MKLAVFIAFWVVLVAGLVVIAGRRDRRRRAEAGGGPLGTPGFAVAIVVGLVGFGVGVPVLAAVLTADAQRTVRGVTLSERQQEGRHLFAVNCSGCHTLAASHAVGRVGPNLDNLKLPAAAIADAIKRGRSRGNGTMPAGLLRGNEAQYVADYVAAVSGR